MQGLTIMAEDKRPGRRESDDGFAGEDREPFSDGPKIIDDHRGNGGWVIVVLLLFAVLLIGLFFLNMKDGADAAANDREVALLHAVDEARADADRLVAALE